MKKVKEIKKTKQISADLNIEDFELLEKTIIDRKLSSKREAFSVIFKGYSQSLNPAAIVGKQVETATCVCEFLVDGTHCCKKPEKTKKVSPSDCRACLQGQRTFAKNQRLEEIKAHGELVKYDLSEKMWLKIGVPLEKTGFDTYSRLVCIDEIFERKDKTIASLKEEVERLASLENDNIFLRQQLEEAKKVLAVCPECAFHINPVGSAAKQ